MFSDSENLEIPRVVTTSRAPKIDEILTVKEIANLEGGIPGGLVVLSACCTGMGMDTAEGLLGPARAVLQAGAAATIVTLFSVDDYSTKTLITDMFRVMKEQGEPALHALRHAMLNMIKEGKDISHWAPLTLIGLLNHNHCIGPNRVHRRAGNSGMISMGEVASARTEPTQAASFPIKTFTCEHAAEVGYGGSESLTGDLEMKEDNSEDLDRAIALQLSIQEEQNWNPDYERTLRLSLESRPSTAQELSNQPLVPAQAHTFDIKEEQNLEPMR
ncbi:hypothetical protein R1flu_007709 [Riccia fluitans]|uniref:CHAT domain-containing protein n=1 Tax=Riccia fluitans TaxID=41844 RepID=A0ABD1YZM0_9MARC